LTAKVTSVIKEFKADFTKEKTAGKAAEKK